MSGFRNVRVVLQAGGKGTRIQAGTPTPKPLLMVDGVPMLERLLRQMVNAGARTVTVIVEYQADRVEAYVRSLSWLPGDLDLAFLRERSPRGNIGALSDLPSDGRQALLCFADLVTNIDFGQLLAIHEERRADVTLASHYEQYQVRLGELETDGTQVLDYREKPKKSVLICSGIGVFAPRVLDLIPRDRPAGISDLVQSALREGTYVTHWLHGSFWMDVNTQEDLELVNRTVPRDDVPMEALVASQEAS
jgi:NDP-sugar pyrophosphorylase family protein